MENTDGVSVLIDKNFIIGRIQTFMSPHDFASGLGSWPTEADWARYMNRTYGQGITILEEGDGFISFTENTDHIFVHDYIATKPHEALILAYKMLHRASREGKAIVANVHLSNFRLVNIMVKRFGFEITGHNNIQMQLERKGGK